MARIAGVDLPRDKRVVVSLTYIYGIGRSTSEKILAKTGISEDIRVKDLTEDRSIIISYFICLQKTPGAISPGRFHIFKSTAFFSPTLSGKPHFPSYRHSELRIHNRTHSRPCQS